MGRISNKQEKYEALIKTAKHMNIAIGEFSKICGSSYVGSLREFKDMVKAKLLLEHIMEKMYKGITVETKRTDPKLVRDALNKMLLKGLGKQSYVDLWWSTSNKAFDNKTPNEVFSKNPDAVANYVMRHLGGDYVPS